MTGTEPHSHPLDWHKDYDGRSNSSERYQEAVKQVAKLIVQNGGHCLDRGWAHMMAGLIVAQLTHVHLFAPVRKGVPHE